VRLASAVDLVDGRDYLENRIQRQPIFIGQRWLRTLRRFRTSWTQLPRLKGLAQRCEAKTGP